MHIEETKYIELLRKEGKQPCVNTPNYLLGLMKQTPEDKMPEGLKNKNIVAAHPDSVFTGGYGDRSFLCVDRGGARRRISLTRVRDPWGGDWSFLAEPLVT